MRRLALLFALLSLLAPSPPLAAQSTTATAIGLGGIDNLLGRVESINIYYGGSAGRRSDEPSTTPRLTWAKDYGLEFLIHIGEFGPPSAAQRRRNDEIDRRRQRALDSLRIVRTTRLETAGRLTPAARDSINRRFLADSARIAAGLEASFVPTSMTVKKHVQITGKDTVLVSVDSEFVGNRALPEPEERLIDFDLGVGYGQMDGLASDGLYELHGSVRELPSISAYATMRLSDRFGIYAGVRTGIITLQDAQLYVPDGATTSLITLSSTSFEFGAPLGIDLQIAGDLHVTAEGAYMRRIFNSLSYDPPSGFPSDFPRSIDLSGMSWSVGVQVPLP
ncbi:MAG TPA: hypothetical protein VFS59_19945 [Gemmatimonadaceae bacterium]|nr:hypothetical protein [Gemmatimonadaceae bacterium]